MIAGYFKKVGIKRLVMMLIGNVFIGMGVSIFKLSGLGNDPFSGMVMALSDMLQITYAPFVIMVNLVLFVVEAAYGRKLIGAGTLVNAMLMGYIITFFNKLFLAVIGAPAGLTGQVITVFIGVVICSFGVSLYQTPNVGISPYDSLSLIMTERLKNGSYFWCRMATDAVCALICWMAGGIIGLGTLVSAFGLGPIIHFFNVHFSEKLLD